MADAEYLCELLWPLLAHRGKKPMPVDVLLFRAGIPVEDIGQARHEIDELCNLPFVFETARGLAIDTGKQGQIADYLYYECGYDKWKIQMRLKHYEGWGEHEWAPDYW